MTKKLFTGILPILSLCLLLTGCAEKEKETGNDTKKTTAGQTDSKDVNLSIWAGEEDKDYLAVVIQNFINENSKEAKITVEWSPMVEGNCRTHLLGNVLEGPDVYTTTDGDIRSIVAGGAAEPVQNPDTIAAENLPASVEAVTVNDTIYGYPITADNGYFLYYNKKYFKEDDIKKLDSILDIAAKNHKKFAMDWSSGWYLYSFFGQTGLKLGLNEDGVTNFCDWNSTENEIKGVDVANALLKIGKNPGFECTGDWIKKIQQGSVIACVSGVWDAAAIKAAWGDDFGASILPTYKCAGKDVQMACYFGYKMLGVNPYSENVEWAHKLAAYISNQENQELRFEMRGQGPSNLKAAESDAIAADQAIQAVLAQSEYSELQRLGGNYWEPSTEFGLAMAKGKVDGNLQSMLDKLVKKTTASTVE